MWVSQLTRSHFQIYFPKFILFANFHNYCRYQSQAGLFIGEHPHHPCPAFDLLAEPLQTIRGADYAPMVPREREDRESFRNVDLHPICQFWSRSSIFFTVSFKYFSAVPWSGDPKMARLKNQETPEEQGFGFS